MTEQPFTFRYRNWRGEEANRRVIPERVQFTTSQWHKGPAQWFLVARDLDRDGAVRHFAMADILGPAIDAGEVVPTLTAQLHDRMTFRLRLAEAALVELAQVVQSVRRVEACARCGRSNNCKCWTTFEKHEPDGNDEMCCGHPDRPCEGCSRGEQLIDQVAQRLAEETIGRSRDRIEQAHITHRIICAHSADPLNPVVCNKCGERLNVSGQGGF